MKGKKGRQTRGARTQAERRAAKTVKQYISRINATDPVGLAELSVAGLRFVDAIGSEYTLGPEGWEAYFSDFPDYRIHVQQILSNGSSVAVFGSASGSFKGRGASVPGAAWHVPAAWRARVRAGKLVEWQVYCDIEPMLISAGRGRSSQVQGSA